MKEEKPMTPAERNSIKYFGEWFKTYKGVSNPVDLNTKEKYDFAMKICAAGEVRFLAQMLRERKNSKVIPGVGRTFPHTQYNHWHDTDPENYPLVAKPKKQTTVALDEAGIKLAVELHGRFYTKAPDFDNPSDINDPTKYAFMQEVGWKAAVLMHKARKESIYGTKSKHWKKGKLIDPPTTSAQKKSKGNSHED